MRSDEGVLYAAPRSSSTARPINGRQPPGRGRRSFTTVALMAFEQGVLAYRRRCLRARENGAASRRQREAREKRGAHKCSDSDAAGGGTIARAAGTWARRLAAADRAPCVTSSTLVPRESERLLPLATFYARWIMIHFRTLLGALPPGDGSRRPFWICYN